MAFLSMLTHHGMFKEIQVGFLLLAHIHEDIDAYFNHLLRNLKNQNLFVIDNLITTFMKLQELSFNLEFIQEVYANFKSFLK